jgi:very-short-patch-repair endonuclease
VLRSRITYNGFEFYTEKGTNHDNRKTAFLNGLGILVLRFESEKVFDNIEAVLETIRLHFKK